MEKQFNAHTYTHTYTHTHRNTQTQRFFSLAKYIKSQIFLSVIIFILKTSFTYQIRLNRYFDCMHRQTDNKKELPLKKKLKTAVNHHPLLFL
uniref:Uncharacterized protein n=1 Tax=Trichobilharzia regenti TaxID=157069 RepID=A0AA85IQ36_TRIRE|nr:unnamed protein product [Trichobilharzia regenti]